MSTFYLQSGIPENREGCRESREFLDDHLHEGCTLIEKIEAKDWKQARDHAWGFGDAYARAD